MHIEHFQYLQIAAQCKSISLASEQLFISQQTLSDIIARLEKHLNLTIFNRSNKGISLTAEGELLLKKIETLLFIYDDILNISQQVLPGLTSLRMMIHQSLNTCFFNDILSLFKSLCPNITLQIQEEMSPWATIEKIATQQIELGITAIAQNALQSEPDLQKFNHKMYTMYHLYDDILYLIADSTNPIAQQSTAEVDDLFRYPLVLNRNSHIAHALPPHFPDKTLNIFMFTDSLLAQRDAIKHHKCIGVTEGYATNRAELAQQGLVAIPITTTAITVTAFLSPKIANTPLILQFLQHFKQRLSTSGNL